MPEWMTTTAAAERLGVKPATLYAYASRGLLHPRRGPGGRDSRYDFAEIERLAARGRRAERLGGPSELWIESSLTLIDDGSLFYRGLDATELAAEETFEKVGELLWTGSLTWGPPWKARDDSRGAGIAAQRALPPDTLTPERLRVIAAATAAVDDLRHDISSPAVLVTFRSLVGALVDCLPSPGEPEDGSLAARLAARLSLEPPGPTVTSLINTALILLADHELTASTVAARAAASVRADPYSVVLAGLGALSGPLHGAASLSLESLLEEVEAPDTAPRAVGNRLRLGGKLAGFGHPLYPEGDPRGLALLGLVRSVAPAPRRAVIDAVIEFGAARSLPPPNVDFALAALTYCTGLRRGSGEAIFAVARSVGWLAHALEEYAEPRLLRPRAVYVGPAPSRRSL